MVVAVLACRLFQFKVAVALAELYCWRCIFGSGGVERQSVVGGTEAPYKLPRIVVVACVEVELHRAVVSCGACHIVEFHYLHRAVKRNCYIWHYRCIVGRAVYSVEHCRGVAVEHIPKVVTHLRGLVRVEHILGERNLVYCIFSVFPFLVLYLYVLYYVVSGVGDSIFNGSIEAVACLLAHLLLLAHVCNGPAVAQLKARCKMFSYSIHVEAHILGYSVGFNVHVQVRVVFVVEFVRGHIRQLGRLTPIVLVCSLSVFYAVARPQRNNECTVCYAIFARQRLKGIGVYATVGKGDKEAFCGKNIYGSVVYISFKLLFVVLIVVTLVVVAVCYGIFVVCSTTGCYCN